jgi:hypothetical protein
VVVVPPVKVKGPTVNWDSITSDSVILDGFLVEGVVLTPANRVIDGSVKQVLDDYFLGIFEVYDPIFHADKLPESTLTRIFHQCCKIPSLNHFPLRGRNFSFSIDSRPRFPDFGHTTPFPPLFFRCRGQHLGALSGFQPGGHEPEQVPMGMGA